LACASFFRAYWYLHPHLEKRVAFQQALKIGKEQIIKTSHRRLVEVSLQDAARLEFQSGKINILLSLGLRKAGDSNDEYYMYSNEKEAQQALKDFFAAKKVKIGSYQDIVLFSKKWITLPATSAEDKELYGQFSNIYSAKEVDARQKKKKKKRKRTLSLEEKIERSRASIKAQREADLGVLFNKDSKNLVKWQGYFRRKRVRLAMQRGPLMIDRSKPTFVLEVHWDCNWARAKTLNRGGYRWSIPQCSESELLQRLFAEENDSPRKEIPSLQGVDDAKDKGHLRQIVEECNVTISRILTDSTESR
jgi:hypothetical protein